MYSRVLALVVVLLLGVCCRIGEVEGQGASVDCGTTLSTPSMSYVLSMFTLSFFTFKFSPFLIDTTPPFSFLISHRRWVCYEKELVKQVLVLILKIWGGYWKKKKKLKKVLNNTQSTVFWFEYLDKPQRYVELVVYLWKRRRWRREWEWTSHFLAFPTVTWGVGATRKESAKWGI